MAKQTNPNRRAVRVVSRTGGGTHRTIGGALQSAPPGTIIRVRPGVYREALVLREEVEIVGDGPVGEVFIESDAAACITMATRRATVRGLTLRCVAGRRGERDFAVAVPRGRLVLVGCDITSDSLSCVGVYGERASAVLRRCHIHDSAQAGVYFYAGGGGVLLKCEITANKLAGVAVADGGDPVVVRCNIHGGLASGVYVHDGGKGTLRRSKIGGNATSNVQITSGGDPTVRGCHIRHGQCGGVLVCEGGKGTFERCRIAGNKGSGFDVGTNGDPVVRACRIRDNQTAGLYVHDGGKGTFEGCAIAGNGQGGVVIAEDGDPMVGNCEIARNAPRGVHAQKGGRGTVEGCDLRDNAEGPWDIDPSCDATRRDNTE